MKWSFKIGKLFGIPIRVHLTFLLLLLFIGIVGSKQGGSESAILGMIAIILIFVCVILHEVGHSLVAVHYGIKVNDIILLPIGGVSRMEEIPEDPKQEITISIAGPLVSFGLALLFFILAMAIHQSINFRQINLFNRNVVANLFWINLVLGLFNLIPAFPMDGGRVLRGILAIRMESLKATKIAVALGQFFALLLFFYGIYTTNWWVALIAIFIFLGAASEERMEAMRTSLGKSPVKLAMLTEVHTVSPHETVGEVLERICHGFQQDFPVEEGGEVVGILTREAIFSALHKHEKSILVKDVMQKDFVSTTEDASLSEIYKTMTAHRLFVIPVMKDKKLRGMINLEQIGKYHMICQEER
ncbi:MAG TPA: site-2 protease family protein [candidate division Zixibacteria bacterium]